jgi:hypothetical protein
LDKRKAKSPLPQHTSNTRSPIFALFPNSHTKTKLKISNVFEGSEVKNREIRTQSKKLPFASKFGADLSSADHSTAQNIQRNVKNRRENERERESNGARYHRQERCG